MHDNTPPRIPQIEEDDDDEFIEEIELGENDGPGDEDDDDDDEMQEVTLDEAIGLLCGEGDEEEEARISAIKDDAQFTFRGHTGPVFACTLHPQKPWAATGGEDDRTIMWNINTGAVLYEITDHKDTVTETHFSYDGNYLVSGDLAGELLVHKFTDTQSENPTLRKVWEYSMGDMSWLRWHRASNVLMGGSDSGEIYVWRIPSGDCKILPGQGVRTEAAELAHDGKKLLTTYNNGAVKLWDLKTGSVVMEINEQQQLTLTGTACAVACHPEEPIYACGDSEGKIIFSTNNGPVGTLQADQSVECLAFAPSSDRHLVASGTLGGQIAIWDYSKYTMRTLCENPDAEDGILRLKWLSEHTLLVCTQRGQIHAFDTRSGVRKYTLTGHHYDIYEMIYKPQENILLTVSEDTTAKIFKLPMQDD